VVWIVRDVVVGEDGGDGFIGDGTAGHGGVFVGGIAHAWNVVVNGYENCLGVSAWEGSTSSHTRTDVM
jgi:hypothetical protein